MRKNGFSANYKSVLEILSGTSIILFIRFISTKKKKKKRKYFQVKYTECSVMISQLESICETRI